MTKYHTLIGCVLVAMTLFSCNSPTAGGGQVNSAAVQGTWQDHLDPNVFYFAGSTHKLTFENDSFFLKIFQFTDIASLDTCYSIWYTQYMQGTFTVGLQDSIILDGMYVDSLKNPLPDCGCDQGPRQSGAYHASFKGKISISGKFEGLALHLTVLSGHYWPTEWVLEKE